MNGFTLFALIALAIGIGIAYRAGLAKGRRTPPVFPATPDPGAEVRADVASAPEPARRPAHARIQRRESAADADAVPPGCLAELPQLRAFAEDRRRLLGELADALAETARYRQIVVDIEHNAPPPLLDAPGTPDDLKLIVGVGPVIERMLYQLGIGTYRQIARLSERDIDDIDARLPEFPGRIRRDGWVTQARALYLGKYGNPP